MTENYKSKLFHLIVEHYNRYFNEGDWRKQGTITKNYIRQYKILEKKLKEDFEEISILTDMPVKYNELVEKRLRETGKWTKKLDNTINDFIGILNCSKEEAIKYLHFYYGFTKPVSEETKRLIKLITTPRKGASLEDYMIRDY